MHFLQSISIACYAEPCISHHWNVRPSAWLSVHHTLALCQNDMLGSRNLCQWIAQDSAVRICKVHPEIRKVLPQSKALSESEVEIFFG